MEKPKQSRDTQALDKLKINPRLKPKYSERKPRKPCHRKIERLREAEFARNPHGSSRKLRGAYAKGKRYEKMVYRRLKRWKAEGLIPGKLFLGEWIKFRDRNGVGYCQPDAWIETDQYIFLLEIKLTQTHSAVLQMKELYEPVLDFIYGKPIICIQVCKNMFKSQGKSEIFHIFPLLKKPRMGVFTWHFIG